MTQIIFSKEESIKVIYGNAPEGIRRIWRKVEKDIFDTTKAACETITWEEAEQKKQSMAVIIATYGSGELADHLTKRFPELHVLQGRTESYACYLVEAPMGQVEKALVIMGSDRLGTIYGMFHVSELLGVSAWGFWGDVTPPSYEKAVFASMPESRSESGKIRYGIETCAKTEAKVRQIRIKNGISKEPSVRYRGFFINDEWPCFGNWTMEHFGGFHAEMYDHVFEYLLRMKGNYLWPAMWTSSFLLDGPGLSSMELATEYGIYIGMSHHEPCMRSGEEFSIFKGENSPYGNEWSYALNKDGLLNFWKDGLERVRDQTIFPTIGMRGERDSKLLGDQATIEDNVSQLKEIIRNQRKLLAEYVNPDLKQIPQLFAIYKEVEDYYFGDGTTSGIRGFEELEDVTLLFCEDNFGNMRILPQGEEQKHPGGFGMYYHLDYHGSPISYEWVNSTPLSKIWEQMTEAYEYGVQKLWIVNAGDVKFNEYPLGYFMNLAYDYETWGSSAPNQTHAYTEQWIRSQFEAYATPEQLEEMVYVLEEGVRLNHLRRPESCNDRIYDPTHYQEGRRMLERCKRLREKNEKLYNELKHTPCGDGYFSMIYFPAEASANLLEMHLYTGLNHLYAAQGKAKANWYGEQMEYCLKRDKELSETFAEFREKKWKGMELASHIGFVNWNDEDWRYPVRHVVTLPKTPRLVVSRTDDKRSYTNQYFPIPLEINDFLYAEKDSVTLEIANGGQGSVSWWIKERVDWIELSSYEGKTELAEEITLRINKKLLKQELLRQKIKNSRKEEAKQLQGMSLKKAGTMLEGVFYICTERESVPVIVRAALQQNHQVPRGTILESDGLCVFDAADFCESVSTADAEFLKLVDFGKYNTGMKVVPVTRKYQKTEERPFLCYTIYTECGGDYTLELHTSPANPLAFGDQLWLGVSVNTSDEQQVYITDKTYRGGDPECQAWSDAVLNQEHIASCSVSLYEGLNQITVYAGSPGVVLERLILKKEGSLVKNAYLGPEKSRIV